jgi:shikimate dehydrogenase
VQATPLGASADDPLPAPAEWVPQAATAVDLRYHPAATPWLLAVRARGVRAANGLGMLIEQALLAQEFWHDTTPPRTALEEAVEWSDPFAR